MQSFFQFFYHLNWLDYILILMFLLGVIEGFALGFTVATFDLLKFVLAFLLGLKFYWIAASMLMSLFHIQQGYANALGFFLLAFFIEVILHIIFEKLVESVNRLKILQKRDVLLLNNILGVFPGVLSAGVFLMFILSVVVALPVPQFLKNSVDKAEIGSFLLRESQLIEQNVSGVFGQTKDETLNFLTVEPKSNESIKLGFTISNGSIDVLSENQMLAMVNTQRQERGLTPLKLNPLLTQIARAYGQEMLSHGYFSHYTPEGLSPFDRLSENGVSYTFAGENLAFSPDVTMAIEGLMNSPGHRANMLSPHYNWIGVGVIDAGVYGEVFVQEFTN